MKNLYDDELLPQNFEEIAKAYSKALKSKGFVFVSLEEEEFNLLLGEIFVLLSKMQACLVAIKSLNSSLLSKKISRCQSLLEEKFGRRKTHEFSCIEGENYAFLALVSLENLLIIKLMLLSIKSGELEICNQIITTISSVFAESFSTEGFKVCGFSSKI